MPVYRVPGGKRGSVNALKTEIDAWYQSLREAETSDDATGQAAAPGRWGGAGARRFVIVGALTVTVAIIIAVVSQWKAETPPAPVVKFAYAPEDGFRHPAISPDGRKIAYVAEDGMLWVQDLAETTPQKLDGTEGAHEPFWAPGSDFLGFAAASHVKKVSLDGNVVVTLCELPTRDFRGGTWAPDGETIVFDALDYPNDFYEVPADGGEPRRLKIPARSNERPHFLPAATARRALLFAVGPDNIQTVRSGRLAIHDLVKRKTRVLVNGRFPVYSGTGHLIYQKVEETSTLWALPFSAEDLRPTGEAFPIARDASRPSVSRNGTLVYREGFSGGLEQLVWRDRRGNGLGPIGQPQESIRYIALSPDERRVAVRGLESGNHDIWIHDVQRPRKERFTAGTGGEHQPVWSPTGEHLLFSSQPRNSDVGPADIAVKPVDQSSRARVLLGTSFPERASDWSFDGRRILYYQFRPRQEGGDDSEIWYLERVGNSDRFQEVPFLQDPDIGCCAKFSPDGRFIVYSSDISGRMEIWVSPFPNGGAKWQVSDSGGRQPRWSRDGTEIFYVEEDTLVAVKVSAAPAFSTGRKEVLFQSDSFLGSYIPQYDATADGQRFVVAEPVSDPAPAVIRVVQNWYEEFQNHENQ